MWRLFLLSAGLAGTVACAGAVRNSTTTAIETLAEPENKAAMAELVAGEAMRAELRVLVDELVAGSLTAATSEDASDRVAAWSERLVDRLSPAMAAALKQDLGPAVRAELRAGIADAIATAASAPSRERVALLARGVTAEVADTLLPRMTEGTEDLLRKAVLPALEDSLARLSSGERSPVRQLTSEALLGVSDALDGELGTSLHAFTRIEREALVADLRDELDQGTTGLEAGLGALSAFLVGLLGVSVWAGVQRRRQAEQSTAALRLLTTSIKDLADAGEADALLDRISDKGRGVHSGLALRSYLADHPEVVAQRAQPRRATDP